MPANKEQWITDLQSGQYPKCRGKLKSVEGFCCLGVLLASQGPGFGDPDSDGHIAHPFVPKRLDGERLHNGEDLSDAGCRHFGLSEYMDGELVKINDRTDTFEEVVSFLQAHDLDWDGPGVDEMDADED